MKLSNIRLSSDYLLDRSGYSAVSCDIEAGYTDLKRLSFFVPIEYENYLTADVYVAFLVAMLYPAMYCNESIEIDEYVSKRIYHNITHYYVEAIVRDFKPATRMQKSTFPVVKSYLYHIGLYESLYVIPE